MSLAAIHNVLRHTTTEDTDRLLMVILALHAQPDTDLAWPSDRVLAAAAGKHPRTIQRMLRDLEHAGEIVRQTSARAHPRIYLVTPHAPRQARLWTDLDAGGLIDKSGLLIDTHAGARTEREREVKPPPTPPVGGGPRSTPTSEPNGNDPHAPRYGATASRRRRDRRRRQAAPPRPPSCPLTRRAAPDVEALDERWRTLTRRLVARGDEHLTLMWQVWMGSAHLHGQRPLELALDPWRTEWVRLRWGSLLAELAGEPIAVTPCAGAPATQPDGRRAP